MQYEKLKDYDNDGGMSLTEALEVDRKKPILRLTEWDKIVQNDAQRKEFYAYTPAWTGTHMKYKKGETKAQIWRRGEKPKTIPLPLNDGWYVMGKDGIPNGEKSDSSNPNARYLYRYQDRDYEGLVVRWCDFSGYSGRSVYCYFSYVSRCGVVVEKGKPEKHKCKFVCETCGKRRK
jgi:hypothetical protein